MLILTVFLLQTAYFKFRMFISFLLLQQILINYGHRVSCSFFPYFLSFVYGLFLKKIFFDYAEDLTFMQSIFSFLASGIMFIIIFLYFHLVHLSLYCIFNINLIHLEFILVFGVKYRNINNPLFPQRSLEFPPLNEKFKRDLHRDSLFNSTSFGFFFFNTHSTLLW